jgi:ElaB/YqjD/DUF883 family membrane-anchored ribosome-binding protein
MTEKNPEAPSEEVDREVKDLKADLHRLREDFADLLGAVRDVSSSAAGEARVKARNELDEAMGRLNEGYENVRREGVRATHDVQGRIEDKPIASVAVAFLAGLVIGKIWSAS